MGGGTVVQTLLGVAGNGAIVGMVQIVVLMLAGPTGVWPG